MDPDDDGKFHYNLNYAPLCFKPPEHQIEDCKEVMKTALYDYLQQSLKNGAPFHEDVVLDSGLTAGEAGVLHFRETTQKRRKASDPMEMDRRQGLQIIMKALHNHMDIDVNANNHVKECFHRFVTGSIFDTTNLNRQLLSTLKCFLREANLKTKGYTGKLRLVIEQIEREINHL